MKAIAPMCRAGFLDSLHGEPFNRFQKTLAGLNSNWVGATSAEGCPAPVNLMKLGLARVIPDQRSIPFEPRATTRISSPYPTWRCEVRKSANGPKRRLGHVRYTAAVNRKADIQPTDRK
jgi:hypothetical protein